MKQQNFLRNKKNICDPTESDTMYQKWKINDVVQIKKKKIGTVECVVR